MIRNSLTGKQKSFLRSMGMKLEPVVQIGKEGVTPTVVQAAREAIKKRELIKVRVLQNCMELPADAINLVAECEEARTDGTADTGGSAGHQRHFFHHFFHIISLSFRAMFSRMHRW